MTESSEKPESLPTKVKHRLIRWHVKLNSKIKEKENALKDELFEDKAKLKQVNTKLKTFIHKEKDGEQKVVLPGEATAYAMYTEKYKVVDRDLMYDWILEGLTDLQLIEQIKSRLDVFGNTCDSAVCKEYRKATGAKTERGQLKGGKTIPGTGLHVDKQVRVNIIKEED